MHSKHRDGFRDDQLPAILNASKRASDGIPVDSCPFCFKYGEKQKSMNAHLNTNELFIDVKDFGHFYSHVGKHMEQLALFALPMIAGMQDEDVESAEAHSGAGTDSRSTRFDFTDSGSGSDERDVFTGLSSGKDDPPLHLAAFNGRVGEVKARLRNGEDPNTTGSTWGNALGAAVAGDQAKIVKLLIKSGAKGNVPSRGYTTIIHAGCTIGGKKTIRKMLLAAFVANKGSPYLKAFKAEVKSTIEILQPLAAEFMDSGVSVHLCLDMGCYLGSSLPLILDWLVESLELIDPGSDTQYFNLLGESQVFIRSLRRTCVLIRLMLDELGLPRIMESREDYELTSSLIKRKMRVADERSSDLSLSRLVEMYSSEAERLLDRVKRFNFLHISEQRG